MGQKITIQISDTLIPESQTKIIRDALKLYHDIINQVSVYSGVNFEDKAHLLFDIGTLVELMKYPVYTHVPDDEKENFAHKHGQDFPQYVYDKEDGDESKSRVCIKLINE